MSLQWKGGPSPYMTQVLLAITKVNSDGGMYFRNLTGGWERLHGAGAYEKLNQILDIYRRADSRGVYGSLGTQLDPLL